MFFSFHDRRVIYTVQLHVQVDHAQSLGLDAKANTESPAADSSVNSDVQRMMQHVQESGEGADKGHCGGGGGHTPKISLGSQDVMAIEKPMASDVQLFYKHYPTHVCMDYNVII